MTGDVPTLSRRGGWSTIDLNDTLGLQNIKKIKKNVGKLPEILAKNF